VNLPMLGVLELMPVPCIKLKRFRFGVMLRDVTTTFNAWNYTFSEADKAQLLSTGNALPTNNLELTLPKLTLGTSYSYVKIGSRYWVVWSLM